MKRRGGHRWLAVLRTPVGASAAIALVALLVMAVVAPIVWGAAAVRIDTDALHQGSSADHLLGTDSLGRDVLARVLVATRFSIGLALLATVIGIVSGILLGTLSSVLGRRAGRLIVSVVDLLVAFPGLLLALVLAVVFGVGAKGAVLAIGFAIAPPFARLTQTLAASVAGQDYVAAAQVLGVSRFRLLLRHILPNIAEPLVINATLAAGGALLAFSGLSFLGLGVQPPSYDWGRLLNDGLDRIYVNPASALAPGIAVILAGLTFNLLGEAAASVLGLRSQQPKHARRSRPAGDAADVVPAPGDDERVLRVEGLRVGFPNAAGMVLPVQGVSFDVRPQETVGIVGESGSGKSLTALAVAGLIQSPGTVEATRLEFAGRDLRGAPTRELRTFLGTSMAMVFQDPMTSMNPAIRVGRQLAEVAEVHQGLSKPKATSRAIDRLRSVLIPDPERRARQYPHEFSGGMRQRAMIGIGLMSEPKLVIADEPTTALDVTVQRQVLRLLRQVRDEHGAAVLLISHDIAVVSAVCDRVLVMYGGTIVEDLTVDQLLAGPAHPYTRALLASVPQMDAEREEPLATIPGRPPEPAHRPPGCPFAPRCAHADERCAADLPPLEPHTPAHRVACWHPQDITVSARVNGTSTRHADDVRAKAGERA